MPPVKVRKLVLIQDDTVFVRAVRKNGRNRYDANLQDLFLIEGRAVLKAVAMRYYHGFVRRGRR